MHTCDERPLLWGVKILHVIVLASLVTVGGCHLLNRKPPTKVVTIVPIDAQGAEVRTARISVNGQPAGQGTTSLQVPTQQVSVSVDASPQYFAESFTITPQSQGAVRVALRLDPIFAITIQDSNNVMNRWLTLNAARSGDGWWSIVVNAIATQDFEIELMDAQSGFIRTAWKERRFGNDGLRRRFVGNVVTTSPLSWRLKYQVQRTTNGRDWADYPRGIKLELDAISEIRARM